VIWCAGVPSRRQVEVEETMLRAAHDKRIRLALAGILAIAVMGLVPGNIAQAGRGGGGGGHGGGGGFHGGGGGFHGGGAFHGGGGWHRCGVVALASRCCG